MNWRAKSDFKNFRGSGWCEGTQGFTLLEVMIAVAILGVSLLALMNFQSQSLLAHARAQRISVATLLARQKMGEILLEIEKGIPKGEFPESKEEEGTFEEAKYPDYFWKLEIKKVELPTAGGGGGEEGQAEVMAQAMQLLTEELSRSTREVRLTVGWEEFDEEEIGLTVVTHVVNLRGSS